MMKNIIKNFYPSWFVVCMGTGIIANLFKAIGQDFLSYTFTLINIIFFAIIFLIWFLRWFVGFENVKKDLENPLLSNYFATMPISLMIIGLNILVNKLYFGSDFSVAFAKFSFYTGSFLMVVFSIITFVVHLSHKEIPSSILNFAYFMPPVGNIIAPILGNEIINRNVLDGNEKSIITFINLAMFGIGFILFLTYLPIIKGRFILQEPIEKGHFPTMFILLAPVGASIVAIKGFAQSFKVAGLVNDTFLPILFNIGATMLWGFGLWIFIALIVLWIRSLKTEIPFSLAYWAYIFPVGIFALASFKVNLSFNFSTINWFSKAIVWILLIVWIYNILMTLKNVFNKKLLTR
ncbi:TDT family transporter [Anaerocellum diazotrophicum]|nr:C4-dicarboxylate ABC transporter [Caldicellulosiruptor diazotrophicus]